MDWLGSLLGVSGLVLVNVAWNDGPLWGWDKYYVYFVLIIGLMTLAAFFYVETRAESPLLPIKVLKGSVAYILLLISPGWGSFGLWLWYTWRYLLELRGLTPLVATAQFSLTLIAALVATGSLSLLMRFAPVSFVLLLAILGFTLGNVILIHMPLHQTYWLQTFLSIICVPFGLNLSFPAGTLLLSNSMPPEHQGLAASLVGTVTNYSVSIALGVAGTVEVQADHRETSTRDTEWGIQCARYTGLGFALFGLVLSLAFFVSDRAKSGWKPPKH